MINSSKYMQVTYSQIDKMKHTIGFRADRVKGTKHRKCEPFRNYYCVTDDGKEFIRRVTGVENFS